MMISFSPGTVTALVGGDGAGKTSLLKTLTSAQGRAQMGGGCALDGRGRLPGGDLGHLAAVDGGGESSIRSPRPLHATQRDAGAH